MLRLIRVNFNFDQHAWVYELDAGQHGGGGPDLREQFSVSLPNRIHIFLIGKVEPSSHNIA